MDEQTSFETRAVLPPRRARRSRLALLIPVAAFVAATWAGLSGNRSDPSVAQFPEETALAGPSSAPRPQPPTQVIGINVRRLDDVEGLGLGRDEIVALAGWYVPTAITDCPPLAAIYRDGSLPNVRGDVDTLTFCVRSGVFYASRPGDQSNDGVRAEVVATLAIGIVAPPELELVGTDPTEVVVVGHFVQSGDGCSLEAGCNHMLVVDHVAWTANA